MKQKTFQIAFPAILVIVMAAFLSSIFFAVADPCFAVSAPKKSSAANGISAVDHTKARIKELQDALKITKAQEELWNKLTQVMLENAGDMDIVTKDRAANAKTMNAVEHLKFHSQITQAHLDQLKKFMPHFEAFYAGLSDEQKKSADTIFREGRHEEHKQK